MSQTGTLVQIKCIGHDVYIGSPWNDTWVKLTVGAFRALVLDGRPAFERTCGQPGSLFQVTNAPDSATFIRIGDEVHIGTASARKYAELSPGAIPAIFNCGLQVLDECFAHRGDWIPLHEQSQDAAA